MKSIMERIICWRIPRLWLIKRGAVSWQDGGERSSWRLPARRLKHWWLFRGRGPSRRAGYRGRRCRSPIASTRRFFAVGQKLGVHHQTVQRCVERAVAFGALAALDDRPRPGKEPVITPEAKAWLGSLACDTAKEHGYPHELWTTRLLARHAREHGPRAGHDCLAHLVQCTVCKLLGQDEINPTKLRNTLQHPAAESATKIAYVVSFNP